MNAVSRRLSRAAVLLLSLAAGVLGGCRKDLCYNHFRQADITLDWEYAWERDYGRDWQTNWSAETYGMEYTSLLPGEPEGVTALIYDAAGKSGERFLKTTGGNAVLSEGAHDFLFYNNDTEYIIFDFEGENGVAATRPDEVKATTTTRTRSTLRALHEGERTVSPPDMLYGAFVQNVPGIELHESAEVKATMRPLVYTYVIRYEFAEGLEHVALARGALAGMAEAVYLRDGRTSNETATLLFDCEKTEWGVQAIVKSFGVPGFPDKYYPKSIGAEGSDGKSYVLNLEVKLGNGNLKTYEFDIADQMQQQPRGGVITVKHIFVSEEEGGVDSGFQIIVENWGEHEDIDLKFEEIIPQEESRK